MFLVLECVEPHRGEAIWGAAIFKTEEAFEPLPLGEFKVWKITTDKDGNPSGFRKHERHHRKIVQPKVPELKEEILG